MSGGLSQSDELSVNIQCSPSRSCRPFHLTPCGSSDKALSFYFSLLLPLDRWHSKSQILEENTESKTVPSPREVPSVLTQLLPCPPPAHSAVSATSQTPEVLEPQKGCCATSGEKVPPSCSPAGGFRLHRDLAAAFPTPSFPGATRAHVYDEQESLP